MRKLVVSLLIALLVIGSASAAKIKPLKKVLRVAKQVHFELIGLVADDWDAPAPKPVPPKPVPVPPKPVPVPPKPVPVPPKPVPVPPKPVPEPNIDWRWVFELYWGTPIPTDLKINDGLRRLLHILLQLLNAGRRIWLQVDETGLIHIIENPDRGCGWHITLTRTGKTSPVQLRVLLALWKWLSGLSSKDFKPYKLVNSSDKLIAVYNPNQWLIDLRDLLKRGKVVIIFIGIDGRVTVKENGSSKTPYYTFAFDKKNPISVNIYNIVFSLVKRQPDIYRYDVEQVVLTDRAVWYLDLVKWINQGYIVDIEIDANGFILIKNKTKGPKGSWRLVNKVDSLSKTSVQYIIWLYFQNFVTTHRTIKETWITTTTTETITNVIKITDPQQFLTTLLKLMNQKKQVTISIDATGSIGLAENAKREGTEAWFDLVYSTKSVNQSQKDTYDSLFELLRSRKDIIKFHKNKGLKFNATVITTETITKVVKKKAN